MLTFEKYVRPGSTRQAYELLQENRQATVIGGMMWLRLADRTSPLGIDLSGCGLDKIEETDDAWRIGAMVTLGQLENHERFAASTCGVFTEAVRDVVGTQFRNLATVGGSLYARMGFTLDRVLLLALDTEVELEGAGTMPVIPFVERGARNDVLTHVVVRKHRYQAAFESVRNAATDFSALNAAAACWQGSCTSPWARAPRRRRFSRAASASRCAATSPPPISTPSASWRRAWTLATTCAGPPHGAARWRPPSSAAPWSAPRQAPRREGGVNDARQPHLERLPACPRTSARLDPVRLLPLRTASSP